MRGEKGEPRARSGVRLAAAPRHGLATTAWPPLPSRHGLAATAKPPGPACRVGRERRAAEGALRLL